MARVEWAGWTEASFGEEALEGGSVELLVHDLGRRCGLRENGGLTRRRGWRGCVGGRAGVEEVREEERGSGDWDAGGGRQTVGGLCGGVGCVGVVSACGTNILQLLLLCTARALM